MTIRAVFPSYIAANTAYILATLTFYTVDANGVKTTTKATLYQDPTGTTTLVNPQTLDSDGKLAQPVYVEVPVITTVSGLSIADHDTGIFFTLGSFRGDWATATVYVAGEFVRAGSNADSTNDIYVIEETHTSGVFATDMTATKLTQMIDVSNFTAADATITALEGLTTAADQMIYSTGVDAFSMTGLTAAGRALLDDANAAAQRTTLGVVAASLTASGIVELSTDAEAVTGTDALRAVTPAALTARLAAPGAIGGTTPAAGTFTALTSTGIDDNAAALAVTIDSAGLMKVGQTSGSEGHVFRYDVADTNALTVINNHATNPYGIIVKFTGGAPDDNTMRFFECTDTVGSRLKIFSDGDVVNHDNSYGAISDIKLKQDITDAPSQWGDVLAMSRIVRKFRMKTDVEADADAPHKIGFIAQELELISPGLVRESNDTITGTVQKFHRNGRPVLDKHGNPEYDVFQEETGETSKHVKYSIAYMKSLKALGEALEVIDDLKKRVAALEAS